MLDNLPLRIATLEEVETFLRLLDQQRGPDLQQEPGFFYFHHPAFVEVAWRLWEAPRGSRPLFLVAYCGHEVAGWWPLVLSRRSVGYRLQNLGQELADYAVPFIYQRWETHREAVTRQFLAAALAWRKYFNFAQFAAFLYPPAPFAPGSPPDLAAWLRKLAGESFRLSPPQRSLVINFEPFGRNGDQFYRQQLSKEYRYHLQRYQKKCARLGPLQLHSLTSGPELAPWRDYYFSWYRYGAGDQETRTRKLETWWEFYQKLPAGFLRASALTAGGQPLSLIIGFHRAGQYDYFSPVFNPEYRAWGPGKVHLSLLLPALVREGFSRFNFLIGEEEYKQHWSKEGYYSWKVKFYHRSHPVAFFYWLKEFWHRRS